MTWLESCSHLRQPGQRPRSVHVPPHSRLFHMALLIKNHVLGHFHRPHKDLRRNPTGFFFQTDQGNPYCNVLCMAGPLKAAKPDGQWGTPPREDWQSSPSVLLETKLFLCNSDLTRPSRLVVVMRSLQSTPHPSPGSVGEEES